MSAEDKQAIEDAAELIANEMAISRRDLANILKREYLHAHPRAALRDEDYQAVVEFHDLIAGHHEKALPWGHELRAAAQIVAESLCIPPRDFWKIMNDISLLLYPTTQPTIGQLHALKEWSDSSTEPTVLPDGCIICIQSPDDDGRGNGGYTGRHTTD